MSKGFDSSRVCGILLTSQATYPPLESPECRADKCCPFSYISTELRSLFVDRSGRCTQPARASIRLGFHDAAGWKRGAAYGGADGSLILNDQEIQGDHNEGLEDIRKTAIELYNKYNKFGVGAADLVQFMATTGVVSCPLGPRITTYVGRQDNAKPPPLGLVPDHTQSATNLIRLFNDKTFTTLDLAALVGAHTAANQFKLEAKNAGHAMDSSPGVWDTRFYSEIMSGTRQK